MTLNFVHDKTGRCPYLKGIFYHKGQRKSVYIGATKTWNPVKVQTDDPELDKIVANIRIKFNEYIKKVAVPKFEECVAIAKHDKVLKQTVVRIANVFDLFIEDNQNISGPKTLNRYVSIKNDVLHYEKYMGQELELDMIDKDFYLSFVDFLIKKKGNTNNTILRKIKYIKTIMQYAVDEEMVHHLRWKKSKLNLKESRPARVPLLENERKALWDYRTTDLNERRTLDAFIFGMYCGLRFEDLKALSSHHIFHETVFDEPISYINMTATKGVTEETIPILPHAYPILERYNNTRGPIFNLQSNTSSNKIIKKIANKLGFNRLVEKIITKGASMNRTSVPLHDLISFHFARYTYNELMQRSGLPLEYQQHNLNHAKLETTQTYSRVDTFNRIIQTRKLVGF